MKRIIALLIVTVLCLGMLASCDVIDQVKDMIGLGQPDAPTTTVTVTDAINFLHDIYKTKKETTMSDFDVVAQVKLNGVVFPVEWTTDSDKVTIKPSTKANYYTVDLPDNNPEEFSYSLTATITADGASESKTYNFKMPAVDNGGITKTPVEGVAYKLFLLQGGFNQRFYALNTTQNNENKFINTTLDPKEAPDFFVEQVDGGYKWYTMVDGVKTYVYAKVERTENADTGAVKYSKFIGFNTEEGSVFTFDENKGGVWTVKVLDLVWGVGTYGTYTTISISEDSYFTPEKVGDSQFVVQFMTSEYANTLTPDELPEADNDAKKILDQLYGLADGESASGNFVLTGKITALDSYNNPTIVVEGYEDKPVYCYRLTDDRFVVGATITVSALQMKNYGGTYEFMSCTLESIDVPGTPVDPDPETPTLGVVDPVAGTAYKFGMVQQNVGTDVYYLIGGMDGYYMATGTDVNAAIDVYLEETEGGYYLYTLDAAGAKLYINMVVSDTHVNGAYEATASTVYTYNTESKTLVASVQPEGAEAPADYWFGTRNDKNYTTVGPCAVSYAGFYCQFYGATEGGDDTPVDPNPETPVVPEDGIYTIPQALAAAVGTNVIVKGQVVEVNQVWDAGYNNMSVTIADADGNELYVFRMGTQVVAGDFITVTGTVGEYNGSKQIAQGATAEVTGHEDLVVDANCKTLSFADVANRTEFTTEKQVWVANDVTLTNNKADSTSNVADYSAPARFYAKSEVVVECKGMTKITFNLNSGKPASGLTDSIANMTGITVEANGNDITIIFDSAVDSFTFSLVAQIRVDSIDVYTA